MTAIIIEDEALAARELESILKKLAPEIEIVARQDSVRGSVQWLKENQVDLIFSDVHLGDGRSFDIFGQVEIKAPVIFITAYDEYALQAFKSQGIDYILKPFDEEEILRALEKVRNWFAKEKKAPRTVRFQERFLVQIGTKIKSVPVAEVAYFMADGKYLMFTLSDYGNFSIWHKEADLWLLDLKTGTYRNLEEVNSDDTESYHNWSSNSHWFVFSSRRGDGLYTRLYISSVDGQGRIGKPFLLPQQDPYTFYDQLIYSYNVPEFVSAPVQWDKREMAKGLMSKERVKVK